MLKTMLVGILGLVLGLAGYPFLYRIYLKATTGSVIEAVSDHKAMEYFGDCLVIAIQRYSSEGQVTHCRNFYVNYLPRKTADHHSGDQVAVPIRREQIRETYTQVNEFLRRSNQKLLPDLRKLSNGWIESP